MRPLSAESVCRAPLSSVRLTLQRKLQRQGRATKSRAAWRLPRLTFNRREQTASAMTPRRLWVGPGGSAAGPKPGAASFTLELGGAIRRIRDELWPHAQTG
jgi:hypothetical protein